MRDILGQDVLIHRSPGFMVPRRERPQSVAVVGLSPRDEPGPLGLATFDMVLPGDFDGCFDGFRTCIVSP